LDDAVWNNAVFSKSPANPHKHLPEQHFKQTSNWTKWKPPEKTPQFVEFQRVPGTVRQGIRFVSVRSLFWPKGNILPGPVFPWANQ
jgi:hypothetical protein